MIASSGYRFCRQPSLAIALLAIPALLCWSNNAAAQSAKVLQQRHAADGLVAEALQRQIYGQFDERSRLLEEAIALSPDCRAARWQSGQVYYTRKWLDIKQANAAAADDNRLARYAVHRQKAADTVEGQLKLAAWCKHEGLLDQQRAHLTRVLEMNADEPTARAGLGFKRVGSEWISSEDEKRSVAEEKTRSESLAAWKSTLERIVKSLDSTSVNRRAHAEEQIAAIRDPKAIPAIESILATHSAPAAQWAVRTLAAMSDPQAALALSRIGVETKWKAVRVAAATALKDRPREQFIPGLLSVLVTPTSSKAELYQAPGGRLVLRQVVERGRQNDTQQQVVMTEYRRDAAPGNDGREATSRAISDVQQRTTVRAAAADQQKSLDEQRNSRVMEILSVATGADVLAEPTEWWSWWNKENEIYVSDVKPVQTALVTERVVVRDSVSISSANQTGLSLPPVRTCECLAAGTPVWTETGPRAIETIRIGDRVLSQNVETGELAYKPVLRTTVRAAGPLVRLDLHGEYIQTSGGHPFWVAGDGWKFARNLKAGAVLCALGEPVILSSAQFEGQGETYNLVVADFNTYFVGRSRVLSHDNTLRAATKSVVPGLAAD